MVSEPIASQAPRAVAPDFTRISTDELRRKVQRVALHNERHRVSAALSWSRYFLPAIREQHAARAASVGTVLDGLLTIDSEELLQGVRDDAEFQVETAKGFIRRELEMVPVNNAWLEVAMFELNRREANERRGA